MKKFFQEKWVAVLVAFLGLLVAAGVTVSPELQTAIVEFYKSVVGAVK